MNFFNKAKQATDGFQDFLNSCGDPIKPERMAAAVRINKITRKQDVTLFFEADGEAVSFAIPMEDAKSLGKELFNIEPIDQDKIDAFADLENQTTKGDRAHLEALGSALSRLEKLVNDVFANKVPNTDKA